jgi:hypothetical protein
MFFVLCWFLIFGCQNHKKEYQTSNHKIGSASITISNSTVNSPFHSIWGIDSIVKSNYVFVDSVIDSIFIGRSVSEAMYLSAWKGKKHMQHFDILKASNPSEYNDISNIHTAHLISIDGKEFLFNGKGDVCGQKTIPESTMVVIHASVYSFYSNRVGLGKYIILDSIKEKSEPTSVISRSILWK